ncbi:AAA family ATPase [Aquiflexum gelatinilyticum]|uniref:AAA family ATPase n=1 Tax=Aquiflexum gelatinilyticum TaxID=2961943 RepID=UPI002169ECEB|nr:AAA family ATPase [Aquiflexum gelatinilyticum]MCS4435425.1 AAA family ATPase [Aquiflexum gelatinilyticum]
MYYLSRISLPKGPQTQFPFTLQAFRELESMSFETPVTVFVGENGSGKSTLLKALAIKLNLPAIGSNDLESDETLEGVKSFGEAIITSWKKKAFRGFFFRAEDYFGFVKRLKNIDQEFKGDIVDFEKRLSGTGLKLAVGAVYGQKEALLRKYGDLTEVSHGEGFLKVLQGRLQAEGIYLIDEPEAALSPQRQLALFSLIKNLSENHGCQFIIATHSPILMTLPKATIYQFGDSIQKVKYEDTEHFTILKSFLNNPEAFLRYL